MIERHGWVSTERGSEDSAAPASTDAAAADETDDAGA
jgi:hypothetical protein